MRVWNAPEFLLHPGQMIVDAEGEKLYFIPPAGTTSSSVLEIGASNRTGSIEMAPSPVLIKGPSSGGTFNHLTIKNIAFENCPSQAINFENTDYLTIQNCRFFNTAQRALFGSRSKRLIIQQCEFKYGYRGFIELWDERPDVMRGEPVAWNQAIGLSSHNYFIQSNTFRYNGLIWPSDAAISLKNSVVKGVVQGNSFTNITGRCVDYWGADIRIAINSFTDCVTDVSDAGALYTSNTWSLVTGYTGWNTFTNIGKFRYDHLPTIAGHRGGIEVDPDFERNDEFHVPRGNTLYDDVCCIFYDDFTSGKGSSRNYFTNCVLAYKLNGGRGIAITRNKYNGTPIILVNRHNVADWDGTSSLVRKARAFYSSAYSGLSGLSEAFASYNSPNPWFAATSFGDYTSSFEGNSALASDSNQVLSDLATLGTASWADINPADSSTWRGTGRLDIFLRNSTGTSPKNQGIYLQWYAGDLSNGASFPAQPFSDNSDGWTLEEKTYTSTGAANQAWGYAPYIEPDWLVEVEEG